MRLKNPFTILLGMLLSVTSAFSQTQAGITEISIGIKYQLLGTYTIEKLNSILTTDAKAFSDFEVEYAKAKNPVKLYRVTYNSVIPELNNKPTVASGLLAIPENVKGKMPVLSYQHGTVFGKTDVPSFPDESAETRLTLANFAGNGYILVAADNFGKGTSNEADAYQIKESTQQADYDMLMAAKEILKSMKIEEGPLFVKGWSMGSWSTALFLQKLQSLNIPVKAAAISCNPTDVYGMINAWIHAPRDIDAIWIPGILALQLNSFSKYYDMPGLVQEAIKDEYQQASIDYYTNKIDFNSFAAKTTPKLKDFLKPEFMAASSTGPSRYWQQLKQSNSYVFRTTTPINVYYGDVDEAITVFFSSLHESYQKGVGGAKTTAISAGKTADHRGTYKFAIKGAKEWFDTLLK